MKDPHASDVQHPPIKPSGAVQAAASLVMGKDKALAQKLLIAIGANDVLQIKNLTKIPPLLPGQPKPFNKPEVVTLAIYAVEHDHPNSALALYKLLNLAPDSDYHRLFRFAAAYNAPTCLKLFVPPAKDYKVILHYLLGYSMKNETDHDLLDKVKRASDIFQDPDFDAMALSEIAQFKDKALVQYYKTHLDHRVLTQKLEDQLHLAPSRQPRQI